ncbi:MAG: gliding motility protein GldM [Flavobacteriales bacterium]
MASDSSLSPRQRLINMMYLVLTAMLAMNVSKEVLDAFAFLNADLVRSERSHAERSQVEYAAFAAAAQRFPEKFEAPHRQALIVQHMADSLVRHIEGIKTRAIAEADGVDPARLRAPDAAGRDTLRALLALEAKDDRDVLTRALIGDEPAQPRTGPGSASELRALLGAFRDTLKALAGPGATAEQASLDGLFDQGPRRDASGVLNNWESIHFYDVPLAAGIATLSKLQADVRAAENDLVKWLYRAAEADDVRFSTLTTAVMPHSTLVLQGDSFRADVFLAAYDTRNPARVLRADGSEVPVGADGKAKLRVRADVAGEQRVEGLLYFEGPKGRMELPYSASYQVMAPLLVASPTKMNVLYRGVDNPIDLSVPGVPADRVQASISSGRIVRSGQGWLASGMTASSAEVHASVTLPDGSSRRVGPVLFRVKDLPPPTPYIAGLDPADTKATRAKLTASQGIAAKPIGSDFGDPWKVQRFELAVVRKGGPPVFLTSNGNAFTDEMEQALNALRPGDMVYVDGIRARLANGQGPVRELAPIAVKVMP